MEHRVGDMLTEATEGYIIHGCNCQGVMGSGIALFIKQKWPEVFEAYREVYDNYSGLCLGDIIPVKVSSELTVINCMTQTHAGTDKRYVDYEAIVACMEAIVKMIRYDNNFTATLHTPLLGAGLAGGNWNIIEAIIGEILEPHMNVTLWTLPNQTLIPGRVSAMPAPRWLPDPPV